MAATGKRPSSQSTGVASSNWCAEELSEANKRLRSELLECRRSLSRIQRELIASEKRTTEREQRKTAILLKDQRCKLHAEKQRDMSLQKDALQRKFDGEIAKLTKQKDSDVSKLRNDLKRCQDQLEEMTSQKLLTQKSGLSGMARGAFERENSRLVQEVQELRDNKRLLESQLQTVIHSDKQKTYLLKRAREKFTIQVNKVRKEGQIEIKKLLAQLKGKERQLAQYEGDKIHLSPAPPWVTTTIPPETTEFTTLKSITIPTREPESIPKEIPGYQDVTPGNQEDESPSTTKDEAETVQQRKSEDNIPEIILKAEKVPQESGEVTSDLEEDSGLDSELSELSELGSLGTSLAGSFTQEHQEPNPSIIQNEQSMTNSLSKLVEQLREQISSLSHEKHDLETRLDDLENRHRPLLEKTRKYLEQNMELTKTNRQLDTLVKQHDIENKRLQEQIETLSQQESELQEKLAKLEANKTEKEKIYLQELEQCKEITKQQDLTINALQLACTDKDKRIEHMVYNKRKHRQQRAQKKVVRFLLPAKVPLVVAGLSETYYGFEEDASSVATSDSLQRSSSHMSADTGTSTEDDVFDEFPREEDRSYQLLVKEHLVLERSYALLQNQSSQGTPWDPSNDLQVAALLEEKNQLNETITKLKEKVKDQELQVSVLRSQLNESREAAEELEFSLLEARENSSEMETKLKDLTNTNTKLIEEARESLTFTTPPTITADNSLQLDTAEKGVMEVKLSELRDGLLAMKDRQVCHLDRNEQVLLLQAGAMLEAADKKIKDLQNQLTVHHEQIKRLEEEKAELLSAATGVSADIVLEYEHARNELLQNKVHLDSLVTEVETLKSDNQHLSKQLTFEAQQHQLAESEKETSNIIHTLRKTEKEHLEQLATLQGEVAAQKKLIAEYETNESILTEKCLNLQESVDCLRERCSGLESTLQTTQDELATLKNQSEEASKEVSQSSELDLIEDNKRLRADLFSLTEQLKMSQSDVKKLKNNSDLDLNSKVKRLEKEVADFSHENTTLKDKLKEKSRLLQIKEEELTKSLRATVGMAGEIASLRKEKSRLSQMAGEGRDKEASILKQQLQDSETSNKVLKENLNVLSQQYKESTEMKQQLKAKLDEHVASLKASELRVVKLIKEKEDLEKKFEAGTKDGATITELQRQLTEAKEEHQKHQARFSDLQETLKKKTSDIEKLQYDVDSLTSSKKQLTEKVRHLDDLEKQLADLEVHKASENAENERIKELESSESALQGQLKDLKLKIKVIQEAEIKARDQLALVAEERSRRIDVLQTQLDKMEDNEGRLHETIAELEEVEAALRERIIEYESTNGSGVSSGEIGSQGIFANKDLELARLRASEERLLDQVHDLEEKVKELENETGKNVGQKRMEEGAGDELEELKAREAELLEKVYSLKLENQELQEHIDQLISDNEGSEAGSPRGESKSDIIEKLQNQVAQLEQDNENLKDQLLRSKLDAMGTLREGEDTLDAAAIKLEADSLNSRIKELEQHETQLKQELAAAKHKTQDLEEEVTKLRQHQEALQDMLDESEEALQQKATEAQNHATKLEEEWHHLEEELRRELKKAEGREKKFKEKIDILEQSEDKLMEQVDMLEEVEQRQREELERLRLNNGEAESKMAEHIRVLAEREEELKETVAELEGRRLELKERQDASRKQDEMEVRSLNEKVNILLDTEEKLIDRLQEQEEIEAALNDKLAKLKEENNDLNNQVKSLTQALKNRSKEENRNNSSDEINSMENLNTAKIQALETMEQQLKKRIEELEEENKKVNNEFAQFQKDVTDLSDPEVAVNVKVTSPLDYTNPENVRRLEESEKQLKELVNKLERNEAVLVSKLSGHENAMQQLYKSEESLRKRLSDIRSREEEAKRQVEDAEKLESVLRTRVADLEAENTRLMALLHNAQETSSETHVHIVEGVARDNHNEDMIDSEMLLQKIEEEILAAVGSAASPTRGGSPIGSEPGEIRSRGDVDLEGMSRVALISHLRELEHMDKFHKVRIAELEQHLSKFREEVETVAYAMETDSDVPVQLYKERCKDTEFEAKLMELVKSEVNLRITVLGLRKSEALLSMRLTEAEAALQEEKENHRDEVTDLEDELHEVRKSEARLRNEAEYGEWSSESAQLDKIQHLEDLVFDLEASERQLQRRVTELEDSESLLKRKVHDLTKHPALPRPMLLDDKNYAELLGQVKLLEGSERDLKDHLEKLERTDRASLVKKIAALERSERGLKREVELLRVPELPTISPDDLPGLDSPESILRRRILELERTERHLKQQIIELERDREELHEIARQDKSTIHDLSLSVRELELSQKHLKEAANRSEARETELQTRLDQLSDANDALDERRRQLESSERQLRHKADQLQLSEKTLSRQLNEAQEDGTSVRQRLQKRIADLERENQDKLDKMEMLTERVSEAETREAGLKSRLKDMENHQVSPLQERVSSHEKQAENDRIRIRELETLNEGLQERLRSLEEDKSSLVYEVSDLETRVREATREVEKYRAEVNVYRERVAEHQGGATNLHRQLSEATARQAELQAQLVEAKSCEREWKERVSSLEANDVQLKERVHELEANMAATHNKMTSVDDIDRENDSLRNQLEQQRRTLVTAEEKQHELAEKLQMYEFSHASKDMASIPRTELSKLRSQAALLKDAQENVIRLEKQEKSLTDAISQLRQGKDACGHEAEISNLKERLNKQNLLIQAHELLKSNYAELKTQAAQKGSSGKKPQVSNKNIQVHSTESFTLKQVTPEQAVEELKKALRDLGANHPQAYEDFVRTLQPYSPHQSGLVARVIRGLPDQLNRDSPQSEEQDISQVVERGIVARMSRSFSAPPEYGSGSSSNSGRGAKSPKNERPLDRSTSQERRNLIGQFVQQLPKGEPENLWQKIENQKHPMRAEEEDELWTNVEKRGGDIDDVTLSFTVRDYDTDLPSDDGGSLRKTGRSRSSTSIHSEASASSVPPPLPTSLPPSSMYRQRSDGDDTSDLDDDLTVSPLARRRRNARSLESIPDDSGLGTLPNSQTEILRERLANLETQLAKRDHDLAQAHSDLADLQSRVKDVEDTHALRGQLREKERQLEAEKAQNIQLNSQLSEAKSRPPQGPPVPGAEILELKSTLEKKEKELQAKNNEIERLSKELREWQKDCRAAQDDLKSCKRHLADVQHQVDSHKDDTNRFKKLQEDHKKLQKEHTEIKEAGDALKKVTEEKSALEKIILKLRGQINDLQHSDLQINDLQDRLQAVENELRKTKKNESDLTRENASLLHHLDGNKRQLSELQGMEKQFNSIQSKYDEMERLKLKAQTLVTPLRARIIRLSQKCQNKDKLIYRLGDALRRHGEPGDLIAEADRVSSTAASEEYNRPLSPLTLAFDDATNSLEAGSVDSKSLRPSRIPRKLRHSSGSSDDLDTLLDKDTLKDTPNGSINHNTVPNLLNHGQDTTELSPYSSLPPVTHLNSVSHRTPSSQSHHQVVTRPAQRLVRVASPPGMRPECTGVKPGLYRAIKDYEPHYFSRSGHQRLELPLREKELVKVLGPADNHGYHEAEVNGRVGLVPGNYLEPVFSTSPSSLRHPGFKTSHTLRNGSPEQILDMYNKLQQVQHSSQPAVHPISQVKTGLPPVSPRSSRQRTVPSSGQTSQLNGNVRSGAPSSPSNLPRLIAHVPRKTCGPQSPPPTDRKRLVPRAKPVVEGPPAPPTDFRIQRIVGNHSVLLSWVTPYMDELARSNGTTVTGYKIFINGRDRQTVGSPHLGKALVEKLNLNRTNRFSIQTVAEGNLVSRMVDTLLDAIPTTTDDGISEGESAGDADISSVMSSSQYEDGERRVFLAVYDYDPSEHSPQEFPGQELSFHTGDIITTYGAVRPDGFYHAKAHGRRGLVPASFIEEVAFLRSRNRRSISGSSVASIISGALGGSSSISETPSSGERQNRPPSSLHSAASYSSVQR